MGKKVTKLENVTERVTKKEKCDKTSDQEGKM